MDKRKFPRIGFVGPSPRFPKDKLWDVYLGNGDGYSTKDQDHAQIIGMLAEIKEKLSRK